MVQVTTFNTLDEAIRSGEVWVINNSDQGGKRKKGVVILVITTQDGSKINVKLPPTWIPINLLNYASIDDLQKCTILRQYVGSKLLVAVDKKSVEALQGESAYDAEARRVETSMQGFAATVSSAPTTLNINTGGAGQILSADGKKDANGVESIQRSERVTRILAAKTPQEVVAAFDADLKNLTLIDAQQITLGAASGSFAEKLAAEVEGYLMDGDLPFNSIDETDTVTLAKTDGSFDAPTVSF